MKAVLWMGRGIGRRLSVMALKVRTEVVQTAVAVALWVLLTLLLV